MVKHRTPFLPSPPHRTSAQKLSKFLIPHRISVFAPLLFTAFGLALHHLWAFLKSVFRRVFLFGFGKLGFVPSDFG